MAQPRDWHGRWTSGGGGGMRSSNSRTINAGRRGTAQVTGIKNGKAYRPGQVASRLATGNAVQRRVGLRPGTPLGGKKNVRYLSNAHVGLRAQRVGMLETRSAGRALSKRTASRATKAPNGYIVSYSPKKGR